MRLLEEIIYLITECTEMEKRLQKALNDSPEGTLECKKEKGAVRYYWATKDKKTANKAPKSNGVNETYLARYDSKTIKALELKNYYSKLIKTLIAREKKLTAVQKTLTKLPDPETVFLKIPQEKRHLIKPITVEIQKSTMEIKPHLNRKADTSLITQNGETVRSKSELIIADRLKAAGIKYYYESDLYMEDEMEQYSIWHPDFLVMNKRTGKQYYWEHLGMLDNPDYCRSFLFKLSKYAEKNYFPGKNLIFTAESSLSCLDIRYVDLLIETYLT